MKTVYWVIFPQGIEQKWEDKKLKLSGTTYKSMLIAKSIKNAWELMKKYDGAYFETIKDNGETRKAVSWFTWDEFDNMEDITIEELWNMWKDKPKIILPKESK